MRNDRFLRIAGMCLLAVTLVLGFSSIVGRARISGLPALEVIAMFPLPLLGGLLVWKKPRHPIGWIMLGLGGGVASAGLTDLILRQEGTAGERAGLAQLFNHVAFAVMVGLFGLLLALFPTGKPPSPRWRVLPWLSVGAMVLITISGIFGTPDDETEASSPLAIEGAEAITSLLGGIGLVAVFIAIVVGGLSVIWRSRTGDATERAQIKWFALAVGGLVALMLIGLTPLFNDQAWADRLFDTILVLITGGLMPACIAIAVLKHRLYDIDLVVNRALVYGALTAVLGAGYLALVVVLQSVLEPLTKESDLAIAGSTLAVAAVFRPLRSKVQSFIDHRFYRRKYNAVQTLAGFAAHLREQVDLQSLSRELVVVVGDTMQPAHASLWLRDTSIAQVDR